MVLNNFHSGAPMLQCNCYKSSDLEETILDSIFTANFKDRYVLGDQLGLGRFGIIRECSDKLTGEVLACKSIAKDRLVTDDDVHSVKLEIDIMTKLSGHENIVDLKAVYEENDYVHLVMELCAGGELFHKIEKQGRFTEYEAQITFKQLMEILMYCHDKGIFHRDLKPENILLVSKSSSSPIKLADFGLATYIQPGETLHGTVGSPFYIAPEVLVGGYNQAADVWSAGVILYILLSGMPPFWGKTKSSIFAAVRAANLCFRPDPWDQISKSAKDLISGMLCLDPSKRLTAAQVLAHSWIKDISQGTQELHKQNCRSFQKLEIGGYSFSNLNLGSDQNFSFHNGSPLVVTQDSLVFSCKSSFSSPLTNESNAPEFSSPIPSMPSFTFFSPVSTFQRSNESLCFKTKFISIDGDMKVEKLNLCPDESEARLEEVEEGRGSTSVSKGINLQSKRNHTIGFGELDHLDLLATESFIRWASCTKIPSTTSLRSSLVC